jgi:hypothetical protein
MSLDVSTQTARKKNDMQSIHTSIENGSAIESLQSRPPQQAPRDARTFVENVIADERALQISFSSQNEQQRNQIAEVLH